MTTARRKVAAFLALVAASGVCGCALTDSAQLEKDLVAELTYRVESVTDGIELVREDVIADPEDVIAGSDVIGDARSLSGGSEATWPVEPSALLAMGRTAETVRLTMTTTARVEGGGGLSYEALSGRVCFTIEVRADSPVELLPSDCRGDDGRIPDHIAESEETIVPLSELELTRS
ncbi:hypothetical protein [Antrihabitans spumae]|uniref:Uncharacterized protein n=1 Tax=Antrihabitans spumae TaxID=3373370 RepID=A0ABW7KPJ8_9NOCA